MSDFLLLAVAIGPMSISSRSLALTSSSNISQLNAVLSIVLPVFWRFSRVCVNATLRSPAVITYLDPDLFSFDMAHHRISDMSGECGHPTNEWTR